MIKHYEQSMSPAEKIDALRAAFQARVGNRCLEPFCLTEAEAEELLLTSPVQALLEAFTRTGTEVRKFRDESMVYLDERAIMQCLAKHIARQMKSQNERSSSQGPHRTRKADYATTTQ
jgi:hypothetical protein